MHSLSLSKIYSAKIFIAWIKYMKSPDNMALSSISLAEIIAGYPIAVIVSKVLYAGFISASTIKLSKLSMSFIY
jgi:hypothetical protein